MSRKKAIRFLWHLLYRVTHDPSMSKEQQLAEWLKVTDALSALGVTSKDRAKSHLLWWYPDRRPW